MAQALAPVTQLPNNPPPKRPRLGGRQKGTRKNPPLVRIRPPDPSPFHADGTRRKVYRPHWTLEWKDDPQTGRSGSMVLPSVKSHAAAWPHAELQSRKLQKLREMRRQGLLDAPATRAQRKPALDGVNMYLANLAADGCSPASIRNAEDALQELTDWLAAHKVTSLAGFTHELAAEWKLSRVNAPTLDGGKRAASSVNQDLKHAKALLAFAYSHKLAPQWCTDDRRAILKFIGDPARDVRVMSVTEIRHTLLCAVAYDRLMLRDRPKQRRLLSPDLALLLLTGVRRAELCQSTCDDVDLDRPNKLDPDNPAAARSELVLRTGTTKGGAERTVSLTDFTVIGIELVRAVVAGRQRSGPKAPLQWLSEHDYTALGAKIKELRAMLERDRPLEIVRRADAKPRRCAVPADLTAKLFRATCCTYELHLSGVSQNDILQRQGHTESVANKSYFAKERLPKRPTLEALMQCVPELERVIALVRERNCAGTAGPRVEKRTAPQPKAKGKLEAKPVSSRARSKP